jgi:undecaprenyl phosphate N,N'-diacetylbacillosamine 1-phosphate transferase
MLYKTYIKRLMDCIVSIIILIFLFPILLLLIAALSIVNRGTPFFFQVRPGFNEKLFYVIKFKTMNNKRDNMGVLLSDEERLTNVGKFVRKTSLDELPQLFNVVRGDMSLVGPRPLLVEYLSLYNNIQRMRHNVTPGITGWAQVNGRNAISWKAKFDYDIWYVNNISFWVDLKILLITIIKVLKSEGISGRGVATTEKFNGSN